MARGRAAGGRRLCAAGTLLGFAAKFNLGAAQLQDAQLGEEGFAISSYGNVPGARQMAVSVLDAETGASIVYVGTGSATGMIWNGNQESKVHALVDEDGDGVVDYTTIVIDKADAVDFFTPNAVAFAGGALFVMGVWEGVSRFDNADAYALAGVSFANGNAELPATTGVKIIKGYNLPDAFKPYPQHRWKYIAINDANDLYLMIGHPCNGWDIDAFNNWNGCATGAEDLHGTVLKYTDIFTAGDASGPTVLGTGIRNTVGGDWDPDTGVFFFTNNGRDNLNTNQVNKDNLPDCSLHAVADDGTTTHFGFPGCNPAPTKFWENPEDRCMPGEDGCDGTIQWIKDASFSWGQCDTGVQKPAACLGPHVVPLGMAFFDKAKVTTLDQHNSFPTSMHREMFIAEHGGWNRNPNIGYRVVRVTLGTEDDNKLTPVLHKEFVFGWKPQPGDAQYHKARPTDVIFLPDGTMLISDDFSGTIFRVTYANDEMDSPNPSQTPSPPPLETEPPKDSYPCPPVLKEACPEGCIAICGSPGNDVLYAISPVQPKESDDTCHCVFGRSGDDVIYGSGAGDYLYGQLGKDIIYAGAGDDVVWGGKGKDILYGGTGDDVLRGEQQRDILYGGLGDDKLFGNIGKDTLFSGWGINLLNGGQHKDLMFSCGEEDTVKSTGDDIQDEVETMNCIQELCAGSDLAGDNCYWQCQSNDAAYQCNFNGNGGNFICFACDQFDTPDICNVCLDDYQCDAEPVGVMGYNCD